jgi:hypothetical protein
MIKKAYLRIVFTVSITLLFMLAAAGGQSSASSMDTCEDCIHECKVEFDDCIARGVPAAECWAKYYNCVGYCPCFMQK